MLNLMKHAYLVNGVKKIVSNGAMSNEHYKFKFLDNFSVFVTAKRKHFSDNNDIEG